MRKVKTVTVQKESKRVPIDGLEDFPLEVLGLYPESIRLERGSIIIPKELLPYLKICKLPKHIRDREWDKVRRYRLRLRKDSPNLSLSESEKRKIKSARRGGVK